MKNFTRILTLLIFLLISISCSQERENNILFGNLSNLPNGIMYLSEEQFFNKIDSVKTVNGKFEFKYDNNEDNEPRYLVLNHIDENGIFRFIGFLTKGKFKNAKYESSLFLSDDSIEISGYLIDKTPKGYNFNNRSKMMTVSNDIKAGYQTNAMFHTDGDLFSEINKDSYKKILDKIKEFPNSFHLLYQINNNRNSFLPDQINQFLNVFKGDITKSETFFKLKKYNNKREEASKLTSPVLLNSKGEKKEVLDTTFDRNLVVFWASWCGPCREEIPSLKKVYEKYNTSIDFVSISTDSNATAWEKALEKENMPWKQFIVNEDSKEYEGVEIFFQLSNSIPYSVLLDKNMKVLKSSVGVMTENELEKFIQD
ncbi:redoxin family protein [Flavobacterium sp. TP390]|uniref:Redoxin family protein n=1 Tax=Flavobacterium profundi TaxID=1774945 RepID=A0A6I4IL78_9FLAO|nr:thioredoxin-like domain-containing protein [Flavobacterium profundi]MVO08982.1 redoxin family protein [Flavobacterium profundi]